jgi:hypothetical protein
MRRAVLRGVLGLTVAVALSVGAAGSARAGRITLNGDERINDIFSGLAGTNYTTGSTGVDYDEAGGGGAHPGEVLVTGKISSLNYHTTGAPGTNVNAPFPDNALDFTLRAALTGISATDLDGAGPGTVYDIILTFGTATPAAGVWDLIVTDPDDGDAVIFQGDLTAGDFDGNPFPALEMTGTGIDIVNGPPVTLQGNAFLLPELTSEYGVLFQGEAGGDPSSVGLAFVSVFNFSPDFTVIGDELANNGTLITHTGQSAGQIFGLSTSAFTPIPEPGSGLLVGMGLLGVAANRRRRACKRSRRGGITGE